MDPITAIGAVARITQLVQTVLSLIKAMYSLGFAIISAAEDLDTLPDDLETFSTEFTIAIQAIQTRSTCSPGKSSKSVQVFTVKSTKC